MAMKEFHKEILLRLRENIVTTIDVNNHILEALKEPAILNDDLIQKIQAGTSNKEKAEILLDILPK